MRSLYSLLSGTLKPKSEHREIMKIKIYLYIFILTFASVTIADDDKYKICFVHGYYDGAHNNFLAGLALHIRVKQNLVDDPLCFAAYKTAYDVPTHFSRTGKAKNKSDYKILKDAGEFSDKVYESISSKINF